MQQPLTCVEICAGSDVSSTTAGCSGAGACSCGVSVCPMVYQYKRDPSRGSFVFPIVAHRARGHNVRLEIRARVCYTGQKSYFGGSIMIVYYTGTGNSRYVAQRFAAALGDDLITANEYIKNDTPADLHSDRPWVFVSPTYGWQIPHIFADFLRRGRFTGSRKAYFVMTCGSEIGNAGSRIAALCADIGLDYQGVLQVVMPENYVAMFYVPGAEESAQIIAAAQPSIDGGIACVQRGEPFPAPRVGLLDRFKTGPVNTIFYRWFVKSGPFTVSDACIGCGKCALSCPVNGIDIIERKPRWNGACTHCMACICGCPISAIEYGRKSLGKPRYQCPEYK